MCFCDGEYLKLTFSIAVFVAWYMRLVFLCIFWYVLAYWRGIDWWFLTYMSRRIDFSLILESLTLNDVLMMLHYVLRTSQMSYVLLFIGGLGFYGCLFYRRFITSDWRQMGCGILVIYCPYFPPPPKKNWNASVCMVECYVIQQGGSNECWGHKITVHGAYRSKLLKIKISAH